MSAEPRFRVMQRPDRVIAVEDRITARGEDPTVAIFHPGAILDSHEEAHALAQRLNAQHDQQAAANQRRADLHQLVDALNDAQVEWTLTTLSRKDRYFDVFDALFGTRTQ